MRFLSYINFLQSKGEMSFTIKKVMEELNLSKNSALSAVHRLKVQGSIVSPSQGFYVIVPPEYQSFGCIPEQDLTPLLMKHLNCDYYVSLLSGALFYGASHQKPNKFQIISSKEIKRPIELGKACIEFTYKKSLDGLPIQDKVVRTGYLKIASPELVAFDLLKYLKKSAGLNHVATVLSELVEAIDAAKLIELADIVKEKAAFQRLGFILDKIETMDDENKNRISDKLYNYLSPKIKIYVPIAQEISPHGYLRSSKWRIIENTSIESDL